MYNDVLLQDEPAVHVDLNISTGLEYKYNFNSQSLCKKEG